MKEKISVIITVFNRRHFLEKALLALRSQSQKIDQLIVSDDGSDEDILGLIKDFAKTAHFGIKYVRQENKGFRLARCRNNAVRLAEGDFLIFVDQDVVYTRDYLKKFIESKKEGRFIVAYPVRLTADQTAALTDAQILKADYADLITEKQIKKIHRQFYKDGFERLVKRIFRTRGIKPKLRGGVCGMYKNDLLMVNGYDENYQGWGNEDDDLGRRLYRAGITGYNPFFSQYPIHMYHEPFHINGQRVNRDYYRKRKAEIAAGDYEARHGIYNPLNVEEIKIVTVR